MLCKTTVNCTAQFLITNASIHLNCSRMQFIDESPAMARRMRDDIHISHLPFAYPISQIIPNIEQTLNFEFADNIFTIPFIDSALFYNINSFVLRNNFFFVYDFLSFRWRWLPSSLFVVQQLNFAHKSRPHNKIQNDTNVHESAISGECVDASCWIEPNLKSLICDFINPLIHLLSRSYFVSLVCMHWPRSANQNVFGRADRPINPEF